MPRVPDYVHMHLWRFLVANDRISGHSRANLAPRFIGAPFLLTGSNPALSAKNPCSARDFVASRSSTHRPTRRPGWHVVTRPDPRGRRRAESSYGGRASPDQRGPQSRCLDLRTRCKRTLARRASGHLRKFTGRNSHVGNGRSQGRTDVGGLRRHNEEFPKADVQSSRPPRGTKARANSRCPTNRTSAFDPLQPFALFES
jgi:hypothetical protein